MKRRARPRSPRRPYQPARASLRATSQSCRPPPAWRSSAAAAAAAAAAAPTLVRRTWRLPTGRAARVRAGAGAAAAWLSHHRRARSGDPVADADPALRPAGRRRYLEPDVQRVRDRRQGPPRLRALLQRPLRVRQALEIKLKDEDMHEDYFLGSNKVESRLRPPARNKRSVLFSLPRASWPARARSASPPGARSDSVDVRARRPSPLHPAGPCSATPPALRLLPRA